MTKFTKQICLSFLLIFASNPTLSFEREMRNYGENEVVINENKSDLLDETCLDEYAIRNKYLKRFVIWAPPTAIVSIPYLWAAIFTDSLASAVAFIFFGIPVFGSFTIAIELKNTIEYLSNRSVIRIIDSLRLNDFENEYVIKFVNKFRVKFPESDISNEEIFGEILRLDQVGSLCNGDLTGSNSRRLRKLLARRKHIFRRLSEL